MSQLTTLSAEEERTLISLLGKVGAVMSNEIFNAVAEKFALTAIETVVLRHWDGKVQVLLTQRDPNDSVPALRNKWHSPGTMLRASDETYETAFERIQARELGTHFKTEPRFVGTHYHHYERGAEIGLVFVCELDEDEPKVGRFFDVDDLPEEMIPHHLPLIGLAISHYR